MRTLTRVQPHHEVAELGGGDAGNFDSVGVGISVRLVAVDNAEEVRVQCGKIAVEAEGSGKVSLRDPIFRVGATYFFPAPKSTVMVRLKVMRLYVVSCATCHVLL